eukprot:gene3219-13238_t
MQSLLEPRREVWEYGLLPLPALCPFLDTNSLQLAHTRLLTRSQLSSKGDRVISIDDVEAVLEMTSVQAGVLYEVLSTLSVANGTKTTNLRGSASGIELALVGTEQIFVHELVMFLFAQLFSKEAQRADSVEYWPESGGFSASEPMSPSRQMGKSVSSSRMILRQQLQQHLRNSVYQLRGYGDYLRRNLKFILELAQEPSNPVDSTGAGSNITARELDRIRFLMLLPPPRQNSAVSSMVPAFFTNPTLPVETVLGALKQSWHEETLDSPRFISPSASMGGNGNMFALGGAPSPKVQRNLGLMVGPSGQIEDSRVSGVYKGTVVRGEGDFASPQDNLHITDCHDSVIYILAPLQTVYVSGCSDCTIVIGAAGRMLRLERCDKLQVMAAASRTVISSCHDCSLYLGTPRPPVFIGDNRFIRLAPLNTRFERQLVHVNEAGVRLDCANKWDTPIVLAGKERRGMGSSPDSPRASYSSSPTPPKLPYSLMPPEDFLPFVTPFVGSEGVLAGGPAHPHTTRWSVIAASAASNKSGPPLYLFPLPPDYEKALQNKLSLTSDLRRQFKEANLSKDKEKELNDAIQDHFREWLTTSNMLRQIYDLSNLERDEASSGATN